MILSIITEKNDNKITRIEKMTKIPNILKKDVEILIVEDETILAMGIKLTLNEFGYSVCGIETSADDAIQHVKKQKPDLIFMDIHLKDNSSGIKAAKYIWQYYKIPIIFLTSYTDDKTIKEAMQSEPYGYLVKPYKDKELEVTIQTALNKHNYFFKHKSNLDKEKKHIFKFENEIIYDKTKAVVTKQSNYLKLTGNETRLLEILSDTPTQPVPFEKIQNYIYRDEINDIGRLRALIYRLKQKFEINFIENVFDLGYKLKLLDD
ncbi:hypothetical protein CPG37_02395 [Malaciobacter canalis]|uniref:Response regulatory domain-containing protein n=3 Tax=Malaciobacter TaxID=2321114 RepID=A0ABX4LRV4_9BACT|nr:hypothetical protein CPG37_02395 [Malaciobacter canalis]